MGAVIRTIVQNPFVQEVAKVALQAVASEVAKRLGDRGTKA